MNLPLFIGLIEPGVGVGPRINFWLPRTYSSVSLLVKPSLPVCKDCTSKAGRCDPGMATINPSCPGVSFKAGYLIHRTLGETYYLSKSGWKVLFTVVVEKKRYEKREDRTEKRKKAATTLGSCSDE